MKSDLDIYGKPQIPFLVSYTRINTLYITFELILVYEINMELLSNPQLASLSKNTTG